MSWRPLFASLLAVAAAAAADGPAEVVRLENAQVIVEVMPRLGGRITCMQRPGGENMLSVVAPVLATPEAKLPMAGADGGFLPANGAVVWLGPQSAWWTQQTLNPARQADRATWPPDPFLEYGAMRVVERSATRLDLVGPPSLVSGVTLHTSIRLEADGAVVQTIEAVNSSDRTVAWDIWPNTRVRADAIVYAPYEKDSRLKILFGTNDPSVEVMLPYVVRDGFLSFDIRLDPDSRHLLHLGKACLASADPQLYAVAPHDLLVTAARTPVKGTVHPDHSPVEVFQCVGGEPIRDILELEFHSGYRTLAPGASMTYAVGWIMLANPGADTPEAQIRLVRDHGDSQRRLRQLLGTETK